MFTAQQARDLAGPSVDEAVDLACEKIKEFAKLKQHSARLYDTFWTAGGYSKTTEWKEACKKLEELGYKVTYVYEERQFVDMCTLVEW